MLYSVNEIFYSIQGEGYHVGKPAVFIRFAGCNIECPWCDTDHSEKRKMNVEEILVEVFNLWPQNTDNVFVVLTGGEPTVQDMLPLCKALHEEQIYIAIETNGIGSWKLPIVNNDHIDWITLSPKHNFRPSQNVIDAANEIKIVFDGLIGLHHYEREDLRKKSLLFLQPCSEDFDPAVKCVMDNPQWRLSIQLQKILKVR